MTEHFDKLSAASKRPLKVFLCHAHADRDSVRGLYTRLTKDGVDAWLDKEKLLPGQDWELEIRKAVREADVVVVCLSKQFNQAGFRQKEVRLALDTAMEQPEGEIFIIPARLEECDNLESLKKWHWVDLFEDDGYEMLMRALRARADKIGVTLQIKKIFLPKVTRPQAKVGRLEAKYPKQEEKREDALKSQTGEPKPRTAMISRKINTEIIITLIIIAVIILYVLISWIWSKAPFVTNTPTQSALANTSQAGSTPCGTVSGNWDVYVVKAGDTLVSIAVANDVSMEELMAINCLSGSNQIVTGQELLIPKVNITEVPPLVESSATLPATQIIFSEDVPMMLIAVGKFWMGSESGYDNEKPIHEVEVDEFYIDKYEVTNILYKACVDAGVCQPPMDLGHYSNSRYSNHPVVFVDWNMAGAYCTWRGARLPTEAEWEKAARGTDRRIYSWGNDFDPMNANVFLSSLGDTTAVGMYEEGKSPFGVYDLTGNVGEWTSSLYQSYPYNSKDGREDQISRDQRILRGGSFENSDIDTRATSRFPEDPSKFFRIVGFRCAKDANP